MKIHNKIDTIFSRSSKVKVLRFLFREDDEHTGRRIARGAGLSPSLAHSVLSELAAERLVEVREKGRARLYRLRKENSIVKRLLVPLFEAERSIFRDLINEIESRLGGKSKGVTSLAIFGSVAAKKDTIGSDFDLLVVVETAADRKALQEKIDNLGITLAEKYGISLESYIITKRKLRMEWNKKSPLVKSILTNHLLIRGVPLEKLLA